MTNCRVIEPKIHGYYEGLINEEDRHSVRTHLEECNGCRDYASKQTHMINDFKRLNEEVEIPFDLAKDIQKVLAISEMESATNFNIKLIFALGFFAGALTMFGFSYFHPRIPPSEPSKIVESKNPVLASHYFQQLQEIESNLSRTVRKNIGGTGNNEPAGIESIAPIFHEMLFPRAASRAGFLNALATKKMRTLFESPQMIVLLLSSVDLKDFNSWYLHWNQYLKNPEPSLSIALPDFKNPVTVALLLKTAEQNPEDAGTYHIKIKLALPNAFSLKERITKKGFHFLYDSEDVWILEFPSSEYQQFESTLKETLALSISENEPPSSTNSSQTARVILTFDTK